MDLLYITQVLKWQAAIDARLRRTNARLRAPSHLQQIKDPRPQPLIMRSIQMWIYNHQPFTSFSYDDVVWIHHTNSRIPDSITTAIGLQSEWRCCLPVDQLLDRWNRRHSRRRGAAHDRAMPTKDRGHDEGNKCAPQTWQRSIGTSMHNLT
jgi:hypothetical protein